MTTLLLAILAQDAVTVARDAIQPHAAIDAEGGVYVVFIRGGNIELSVSSDKGKSFGPPVVAIDAQGRAKGGMQRGPRVAVDAKKNVYVTAPLCFDAAEFGKQYPVNELWIAASKDGGKTFGKPIQVNAASKKAPESLHWMACAPGGDVFVAWLNLREGGKGQDLAWAKVTDAGAKVGKNGILPGPLCECCAPGLAVDAKGNPTVVYREGGGKSNRQLYVAVSSNGGSSFAKVARLNQVESKVDG